MGIRVNSVDGGGGGLVGDDDAVLVVLLTALAVTRIRDDGDRV